MSSYSFTRRRFLQASGLAVSSVACRASLGKVSPHAACGSVVQEYVDKERFQGVVMLGRGGRPQFSMPVGYSDIEKRQAMAADSVFGIASISKMLTSVTVLKLQERRLLSLDESIGTYLPYFRKDLGATLTLRYLMANNSGVPNLFSPAMKSDAHLMERPLTTQEAVHRFCEGDLIFKPGERFDYSLPNWILVLAIVEAVTKVRFADAMQSITLRPLGLTATSAALDVAAVVPYTDAQPAVRRPAARQPYIAAAGGYFSTAPDLMRAGHLIFDTSFLTAHSRQELTTVEVPSDQYALGGRIRQIAAAPGTVPAAWDTGNTSGYRSVLGHRLDGKATVVVLNNTSMSQKTLDEFSVALLAAFA